MILLSGVANREKLGGAAGNRHDLYGAKRSTDRADDRSMPAAQLDSTEVEAPGIEPSRLEGRERRCSEIQPLYRLNASFDAPPRESFSVRFRPCRGTVWGTDRVLYPEPNLRVTQARCHRGWCSRSAVLHRPTESDAPPRRKLWTVEAQFGHRSDRRSSSIIFAVMPPGIRAHH